MKEGTPKNVILESLRQDLRSRDDYVRHRAIRRLGEIGTDEAVSTLISVADAEPMRKIGPISLGRPSLSGQLDALTVLSYSESDEAKRYVHAVATPHVWEETIKASPDFEASGDPAYYSAYQYELDHPQTEIRVLTNYPSAKGKLRNALEGRGRYNLEKYTEERVRARIILSKALERVNPESNTV